MPHQRYLSFSLLCSLPSVFTLLASVSGEDPWQPQSWKSNRKQVVSDVVRLGVKGEEHLLDLD